MKGFEAAAGWALFRHDWGLALSREEPDGALGAMFDARSCDACHAGAGPGRVGTDSIGAGMIVRFGRADGEGDSVYGRTLQSQARPGVEPEGTALVRWNPTGDLRTPEIAFSGMRYGPLAPDTHAALRRAPPLFGLGLLESIPDEKILARKSGRTSWLASADGSRAIGRFGWKAGSATLPMQIATAFQRDFGIATTVLPATFADCTPAEEVCRAAAAKSAVLTDRLFDAVVAFVRYLRPPPALDERSAGFAAFRAAGCMQCHDNLMGADGAVVHAFTDLRLHDMGPDLDDGIAEGGARPGEWRTAPLWDVSDSLARGGLLHDGRARSVAEAVAAHGGEAAGARARFVALPAKDRAAIEAFLLRR
ncbi:MAG TPA: di-heme oxidoredictase family protein [Rhizomicrobium sp.]|nr:di-heme oxidoredictase family protein [Rhizomicrobium sp.]